MLDIWKNYPNPKGMYKTSGETKLRLKKLNHNKIQDLNKAINSVIKQ